MGKSKDKEKDFAKLLYLDGKLTQKEIADRVGVTEKTLGGWIVAGKWEALKVSMLTTKDNQLVALYKNLQDLNHDIQTRKPVRDVPLHMLKPIKVKQPDGSELVEWPKYEEEDYPIKIGNTPTSKEADIIAKITTSIKRLETETSVGDTIEVAKKVIQFIQSVDSAFAKTLTDYFDAYINSIVK